MSYLKGIGLLLLGVVLGGVSTTYLLQETASKIEVASDSIQKFKLEIAEVEIQRNLFALRARLDALNTFLNAYKEGSDLSAPYLKEVNEIKESLSYSKEYLKHVNSNSTPLHENVQRQLDNLTRDLEFEFGSF